MLHESQASCCKSCTQCSLHFFLLFLESGGFSFFCCCFNQSHRAQDESLHCLTSHGTWGLWWNTVAYSSGWKELRNAACLNGSENLSASTSEQSMQFIKKLKNRTAGENCNLTCFSSPIVCHLPSPVWRSTGGWQKQSCATLVKALNSPLLGWRWHLRQWLYSSQKRLFSKQRCIFAFQSIKAEKSRSWRLRACAVVFTEGNEELMKMSY